MNPERLFLKSLQWEGFPHLFSNTGFFAVTSGFKASYESIVVEQCLLAPPNSILRTFQTAQVVMDQTHNSGYFGDVNTSF